MAAQALGMNKVVSEDAPRRALERIDEASSTAWMRPALMHSVREVLNKPWVLDIDASIKSLVANIRKALQQVRVAARQFKAIDPWATLPRYVSDRIAPAIAPFRPPAGLPASG